MKAIDQIETEINELNDKLGVVNASIEKKTNELSSLNRSHKELIARNAGKLHMPKAIEANRKLKTQLTAQLDDLHIAQASLQESLQQTTEYLELAVIYNQVAGFREGQHVFNSMFYEIYEGNIVEVIKSLVDWQEKVEALKKLQNPVMVLEGLFKELQKRNLSYRAFIEQGEIKEASMEDNNAYIDEIRSTFRKPLTLMRDLVLPSVNEIGSSLINCLSWADGANLADYKHKAPAATSGLINPVKQSITNTVEFINPLTRDPNYFVKLKREESNKTPLIGILQGKSWFPVLS